jgi:hypothetical protein
MRSVRAGSALARVGAAGRFAVGEAARCIEAAEEVVLIAEILLGRAVFRKASASLVEGLSEYT